jgi:L-ribulose-5-phosphate 3-epimerase
MPTSISRRRFVQIGLQAGALLTPAAHLETLSFAGVRAVPVRFKVGVPDWNLKLEAKIEAIALAKKLGFDGVQISLGHEGVKTASDHLPLADPKTQQAYLAEAKRAGIPITSVCLEILHRNYLKVKTDPLGARWVAEAIPAAKALGVRVILLPFFGNGALKTEAEMDYVGDVLREQAPAAEKAGVILGLEDTISAKDNVRIMERTKSPAVLTYYDVGNSTRNGFDVLNEIKWLGRERICEVHLKDNPHYLGEGTIDFGAVVRLLGEIGFQDWAQLECDAPSGNVDADMTRNLAFIRDRIRDAGK